MWWSHYCFFILLFLVSLWLRSQTQIISSFRNLCSKHLLTGMCFEGNVAEKQILPEQRKEKAGTDDSPWSGLPPTQHLLRRAVVLLTGPVALWVIARGSQEEGSQKIRVRGRGTVKEQPSQEGGCRLVSPAEPHRGVRCMLICCSLFTCVSIWEHSSVCFWLLLLV